MIPWGMPMYQFNILNCKNDWNLKLFIVQNKCFTQPGLLHTYAFTFTTQDTLGIHLPKVTLVGQCNPSNVDLPGTVSSL